MTVLEEEKIEWFRDRLFIWAKKYLRDYPWRKTDDPYHILVAEFLLQKTDADTVAPIYEAFLNKYSTLYQLVEAPLDDVALLMQPLGLFFRARRLSETAAIIAESYQGKIPNQEKELLKLPGIGKYTARAICSQAFKQPAAVMDTNVARILERFLGIEGERVKSRCKILWSAADNIAPPSQVGYWNLILLDFGALICTSRSPKCSQCPLRDRCYWLLAVDK